MYVNIKIYDWVGEYKEQDFKLLYNHPANDSYQSGKTPVKSTDIITFKDIVKQRESYPVRYKKIRDSIFCMVVSNPVIPNNFVITLI